MEQKGKTQSDVAICVGKSVHNCVPKTEFYWAMIDNAHEHLRENAAFIQVGEDLDADQIAQALEILTGIPRNISIQDILKGR